MISEFFAPYASVDLPKANADNISPVSHKLRCGIGERLWVSLNPPKPLQKRRRFNYYWNCMSPCGPNAHVLSSGSRLLTLRGDGLETAKVLPTSQPISYVLGNRSQIACRDFSGDVRVLAAKNDGSYSICFERKFTKEVRHGITYGGFCVSDSNSISAFDIGAPEEPIFVFSEGGGPVTYCPENSNVIYHGSSLYVCALDLREGMQVANYKVHPGAISLAAYTSVMDYRHVSVNPRRPHELAAFSEAHCLVQLFDVRNQKGPVCEIALPGREELMSPVRTHLAGYRHMEYSPNGSRLAVFKQCSAAGVLFQTKQGLHCWEEVSLCPETEASFGTCWDHRDDVLLSLSESGKIYSIEARTTQESPIKEGKRKSGRFVMIPFESIAQGLNSASSLKKPETVKALDRSDQLWLKAKIGLIQGLAECHRHPVAAHAEPGSYMWNRCIDQCKSGEGSQPPPVGTRKISRVFKLVSEYSATYGEQLDMETVRNFLRELGPPVKLVNSETILVEFLPPMPAEPDRAIALFQPSPEVSSGSDSGDDAEAGIMTQKIVLEKRKLILSELPKTGGRLIDLPLVEHLKQCYGVHPNKQSTALAESQALPDFDSHS